MLSGRDISQRSRGPVNRTAKHLCTHRPQFCSKLAAPPTGARAEVANSQPKVKVQKALTLQVLSIPPTVRLPALVKHLLAKDSVLLSDAICEALDLPKVLKPRMPLPDAVSF